MNLRYGAANYPEIDGMGASVQFLWYYDWFRIYCDKGAHHLEQTPP